MNFQFQDDSMYRTEDMGNPYGTNNQFNLQMPVGIQMPQIGMNMPQLENNFLAQPVPQNFVFYAAEEAEAQQIPVMPAPEREEIVKEVKTRDVKLPEPKQKKKAAGNFCSCLGF